MDNYLLALKITVIAVMTLMFISFSFVGLLSALPWITNAVRKVTGGDLD